MFFTRDFAFVLFLPMGAALCIWAVVGLWRASRESRPATLLVSLGLGFAVRVVLDLAANVVSLRAATIWREEWWFSSPTLAIDAALALLAGLAAFLFVSTAPVARPRMSAPAVTLAAAVTGILGVPPLAAIPLVVGSQLTPSDTILVMEQAGRQLAWIIPLVFASTAARRRRVRASTASKTASTSGTSPGS